MEIVIAKSDNDKEIGSKMVVLPPGPGSLYLPIIELINNNRKEKAGLFLLTSHQQNGEW